MKDNIPRRHIPAATLVRAGAVITQSNRSAECGVPLRHCRPDAQECGRCADFRALKLKRSREAQA